jgi:hypothetical protein
MMLCIICLDTKLQALLDPLFSLSCLLAVQVSHALCYAELSETIVDVVKSFLRLVMLRLLGPDTHIQSVLDTKTQAVL